MTVVGTRVEKIGGNSGAGSETGKSTVESSEKLVWALSLAGILALSTRVSVELVEV